MNTARRSLLGLAVGDGFGERFFLFEPVAQIHARIDARTLPDAPWRWTDDTAQAITLLHHLETYRAVDQDALAAAFAETYRQDPRRGYGAGAHDLLCAIGGGGDWRQLARAAFDGTGSMGNGAAMRVAPLGAFFAHDLDEAAHLAARSAEVSHPNINGIAGAVAVAVAAAAVAQELPNARLWAEVLARTPESRTREIIEAAATLGPDATVARAVDELGNGRQVCAHDTVGFCLWAVARHRGSYESALWATVSGLGDRDTTCAIVGGILASSANVRIPVEWIARTEPLSLHRD